MKNWMKRMINRSIAMLVAVFLTVGLWVIGCRFGALGIFALLVIRWVFNTLKDEIDIFSD